MNRTNSGQNGDESETVRPRSEYFYRVVWRWHFYAGLFVVPFLVTLSITGIIYLFKPQLDALMYRRLLYVAPQTIPAKPPTAQMEAVRLAYANANIKVFAPGDAADRSSQFEVMTSDGRSLLVFVDPYTARVLGDYDAENNLQAYAVKLHGELMIGRVGDTLVELAACWALVLIVSGLYLWFPRQGSGVWGTLLPRLSRKNKRQFWRDLHAVPGFYGSLIVVFMILTGLPWAGFWGTNFASVWSRFPSERNGAAFRSTATTGSLNTTAEKNVPWAVEQMPLPNSVDPHAGHMHRGDTAEAKPGNTKTADGVDLNAIVALAQERGVVPGYRIVLPQGADGVYTISAPMDDPTRESTIHVDRYNGAVLADVRWKNYGAVAKAVSMGIALHEGKYFGLANQLLMLFAALVVLLLAVSGTVMWWRRRPAKKLGAPPMPENFPLWKTAVGIICVMGVLFPFVGASLIVVLLLDYFVLRRSPKFKAVIG